VLADIAGPFILGRRVPSVMTSRVST
jgi:hypothetical protein